MSYIYNDLKPAKNAVTYTNKKTATVRCRPLPAEVSPASILWFHPRDGVRLRSVGQLKLLDYITFEPANADIQN